MTVTATTAPTTFAEVSAFETRTIEFPRSFHEPKGARSITTEWVLSRVENEAGGYEEIVVKASTHHSTERKRFFTSVNWTRRTKEAADSYFTSEAYALFSQASVTLGVEPVARYSAKALTVRHAQSLAQIEAQFEAVAPVFAEAFAKIGGVED